MLQTHKHLTIRYNKNMETTSNDMNNYHLIEEDSVSDSEDKLSLCDLSFTDYNPQDMLHNSSSPDEKDEDEDDDFFRFSENPNYPTKLSPMDSLLLFGKSIPYKKKPSNLQYTNVNEEELEQERSRLSLFRSDSFNRFSSFRHDNVKTERFMADYYGRSSSLRLAKKSEFSSVPIGNSRNNNVSGGSRKYKALFGVTKFPAKMELNEIRRRQSRLPPAPMFPATSNGAGGKSLWGLVRPLRSRSHLLSALARTSLGCIPRV